MDTGSTAPVVIPISELGPSREDAERDRIVAFLRQVTSDFEREENWYRAATYKAAANSIAANEHRTEK